MQYIPNTNNITMGQSSSKMKMGLVRVKQCLNPESSFSSAQKELFRKEKWELDKGRLKEADFVTVLPFISEARIAILNLVANNHSQILKEIAPIRFPALLRLSLCGNAIECIDPLSSLEAPQLLQLSLSWNYISTARPLRRCHFPRLIYLNIQENPINDLGRTLPTCHFPQLRELVLETSQKSSVVCDGLQMWIFRCETDSLYEIQLRSAKRIPIPRKSMLPNKYERLKILRLQSPKKPIWQSPGTI